MIVSDPLFPSYEPSEEALGALKGMESTRPAKGPCPEGRHVVYRPREASD